MGFVVFLILFFALLVSLLFIPVVLCIDTTKNQYFIQLRGLATVSVKQHEKEVLQIRLKVLLFNFYFYPLRKTLEQVQGKKKKVVKKEVKKHKKRSKRFDIRKMISILRTFKVKKVLINLDTGDDILNAKLYPLFGLLNHYVGTFHVNFEGRNQLVLQMQNRPIHIIKSFINK